MSQKILVVDDSRTIRRAVELIYHGSSYEVVGASTASDALGALSEHRPVAAIIDYHLPDQSGLDFCAELRQNPAMKDVALVVLGGKHHPFEPSRVAEVGANAYIMKPFKTDPLIEAVMNAISNLRGRPSIATPGSVPAVPSGRPQGGPPPPPPDARRATPPPPPQSPPQAARTAEVEVEQIVTDSPAARSGSQGAITTGARPAVSSSVRPAAPSAVQPAVASGSRPAAVSGSRPAAVSESLPAAQSGSRPAAQSGSRPAATTGASAAVSAERRAAPGPQTAVSPVAAPAHAAAAPPQSITVEVSEEMVREAVRQVVPDIVKQVLASLLRETIGPRVETYARRKIDDFVEKDLPQLADEAIERQLAALTGADAE